jgi:hypothetical protein
MIFPAEMIAQDHIVPSADLRKDLAAAARAREDNRARVVSFFSSRQAEDTLQSAGFSHEKIVKAVPQLSDEELVRLASLTDKVERDFAAGALSNQEITYILIALGTAVLVLVLVH